MKPFLLSLTVSGIKNIDKPIELNFHDKIIPKSFSSYNTNIKAIYGENGSGKSGIVHALKIYHDLIMDGNYLYDTQNIKHLNELINNKLNKLFIEVTFLLYLDINGKPYYKKYKHSIELESLNISKSIEIVSEKLFIYERNSYKDSKATLAFENKFGKETRSSLSEKTKDLAKNQLNKKSIISIYIDELFKSSIDNDKEEENQENKSGDLSVQNNKDINILAPFSIFANHFHVFMDDSDNHSYFLDIMEPNQSVYFELNKGDFLITKKSSMFENKSSNFGSLNIPRSTTSLVISKDDKSDYLKHVKKLEKFIKLFKKDLTEIIVDFRPYKISNDVIAELWLKYDSGEPVFIEFESTGIKKLVVLFEAFSLLEKGNIVVVDELDANIHDVYLLKMIEYFSEYSEGQFIFTTHNLGPMEILKSRKHSLDFLTSYPSVTSWVKNGNYSITNLYRKGLLKNLPFNIESADFIGIFDDE